MFSKKNEKTGHHFAISGVILIAIAIVIFAQCVTYSIDAKNSVNVQPGLFSSAGWLTRNWQLVGLVISEILALAPGRANGILHGIYEIANAIFKR